PSEASAWSRASARVEEEGGLMAKAEEPWTQLATRIPKELHRRLKLHCVTHDIALMHFSAEGTGRLVILSGPSCVGKTPLAKALGRFHPDLSAKLQPIVLYNSRPPRPGERDGEDYHFRSREQIEALRDRERHVVMDLRGDLQALD